MIICVLLALLGHGTSIANERTVPTISSGEIATERSRETLRDTPDIIEQEFVENVNVDLIGRWIGGNCHAVAVQDSIAYVGVLGGLIIVDFSSLDKPVELAQVPLPGRCENNCLVMARLCVRDQYVYVADGDAGLRIVDVTDPADPREIGSFVTGAEAYDVALRGNYACVSGRGGIRVIDVSDPADPFEVGDYHIESWTSGVAVSGDYAYLASNYRGLRIIDISNPANPFEIGAYDTPGYSRDVAVTGDYAYVADDNGGLRVIDVSDRANPREIGFEDTRRGAMAVAVSGNYAYVGNGIRFQVIDISDPSNPWEVVSRRSWGDQLPGIAIEGDLAYFANERRGVRVRNISNPAVPDIAGEYETGAQAYGVAVRGDYAYVADHLPGLYVLDISNPGAPKAVGRVDTPGGCFRVELSGQYAFVGDGFSGLRIIDVSNPTDPWEVAFYDPPEGGDVGQPRVRGDHAYVTESLGLRILNISDPAAPFEESFYTLGAAPSDIDLIGDHVFLGGGKGLHIVNIVDPAAPFEEALYGSDSRVYTLAVEGNHAYVATRFGDLCIINISDPANPVEEGAYSPGNWRVEGVAVNRGYAYVGFTTNENSGIRIIDVRDPQNPSEVGFYRTGFLINQVVVHNNNVYVAENKNGLFILEFQPPVVTLGLDIKPGSCPNPLNTNLPNSNKANGGVLSAAVLGSNELDVRDIDVSSLELAGAPPLRHSFKDIATPPSDDDDCACSEAGPDGYTDLELKFRRLDVVAGLDGASGDNVPVRLTGQLKDGTPIEGIDCVRIVPRKGDGGPQLASTSTPAVTALGAATPNPFNPTTTISYDLAARGHVTLKVYDVTGKLVATLVDGEMPGGGHNITWEASGVVSGVYFYRMQAGDLVQTRKMVLLK